MQWVMDARSAELEAGDRFQLFLVQENGAEVAYRGAFPELQIEQLVEADSSQPVAGRLGPSQWQP